MSRGWESKSVESQQSDLEQIDPVASTTPIQPTPIQTVPAQTRPVAKGNITADAEQRRRRQALELQRERILSERTSSPHRRSALANALTSIEEELSQLGWTVHL